MRRTLFSDLHGNHRALEALLEREPGTVISAGDVLGRSGSNQKCLELMQARAVVSVQGNHELRMIQGYSPTLEEWALKWIRRWPLELLDDQALVTHTLFENHDFWDIEQPEQAQRLLARRPLVFTGHRHRPGYWLQRGSHAPFWTSVLEPRVLTLETDCRYLIQIGSLGEPKAAGLPRYLAWRENHIQWFGL